jgi:hypothetical protein
MVQKLIIIILTRKGIVLQILPWPFGMKVTFSCSQQHPSRRITFQITFWLEVYTSVSGQEGQMDLVQASRALSCHEGSASWISFQLTCWLRSPLCSLSGSDHLSAHLLAGITFILACLLGSPFGSPSGLDQLSAHPSGSCHLSALFLARITFRLTFWLRSTFASLSGSDHLSAHLLAWITFRRRPTFWLGSPFGPLARISFRLTFWLRSVFGSLSGSNHLSAHLLAGITFRLTFAFRLIYVTLAF